MKKLTFFSILIHVLISITNGQLVRDLFYQKPGWSNVPERPQNCTFPCYDMSNKMLNFDIIVSLDEDCPKLKGNMEIKPFQKMSPCANEEVKLSLYLSPLEGSSPPREETGSLQVANSMRLVLLNVSLYVLVIQVSTRDSITGPCRLPVLAIKCTF